MLAGLISLPTNGDWVVKCILEELIKSQLGPGASWYRIWGPCLRMDEDSWYLWDRAADLWMTMGVLEWRNSRPWKSCRIHPNLVLSGILPITPPTTPFCRAMINSHWKCCREDCDSNPRLRRLQRQHPWQARAKEERMQPTSMILLRVLPLMYSSTKMGLVGSSTQTPIKVTMLGWMRRDCMELSSLMMSTYACAFGMRISSAGEGTHAGFPTATAEGGQKSQLHGEEEKCNPRMVILRIHHERQKGPTRPQSPGKAPTARQRFSHGQSPTK